MSRSEKQRQRLFSLWSAKFRRSGFGRERGQLRCFKLTRAILINSLCTSNFCSNFFSFTLDVVAEILFDLLQRKFLNCIVLFHDFAQFLNGKMLATHKNEQKQKIKMRHLIICTYAKTVHNVFISALLWRSRYYCGQNGHSIGWTVENGTYEV